MNPAQFELLSTLKALPGASQAELARKMDLDQTTLSRNLKLVIERGWATVIPAATDHRRFEYTLSEAGAAALSGALPCWSRATDHLRIKLGGDAEDPFAVMDRLSTAAE